MDKIDKFYKELLWSFFREKLKNFSNVAFGKLQNLSRVIVFPVAVLPVAGLFLGLGGGLSAAITNNISHLSGSASAWNTTANILNVLKEAGGVFFTNLGLIFCVAVAMGFAKKNKGVAAFSALISFVVMTATIHGMFIPSKITGGWHLGFDPWNLAGNSHNITDKDSSGFFSNILGLNPTIDTSVFGGLLLGTVIAAVHNRSLNIRLPRLLSFFGGTRFVPILGTLIGVLSGIVVFFIWPALLVGFRETGKGLGEAMNIPSNVSTSASSPTFSSPSWHPTAGGFFACFALGSLERLLIPTGLHHVLYTPFWFTSVGGTWHNGSEAFRGAYTAFFAQNASKFTGHLTFFPGTVFLSGRFSFMDFGFPLAALAMYLHARPENRRNVGGIMLSAGLTSMITGITEPILFSFIFVAPLCWGLHIIMSGLSFATVYLLDVVVGQGFSAGLIDLAFFGALPEALGKHTGFEWIFLQGAIQAVVYFFGFYYIIKWKNYQTLGRGDVKADSILIAGVKGSLAKGTKHEKPKVQSLLEGLGLRKNVVKTKLVNDTIQVKVNDVNSISKALLQISGTKDIRINAKDNEISIRYLDNASGMISELDKYLKEQNQMTISDTALEEKANSHKKGKKATKAAQREERITVIIKALGGIENIQVLDNCATRLRVTLKDMSLYDESLIKSTGSLGIVKQGNNLQIIYGTEVINIRADIDQKYNL